MAAADVPIPPEVFYDDAPPLDDADLDRLFAAVDMLTVDASVSDAAALEQLAAAPDDPNMPSAQHVARWEIADDAQAAWAAAKLAEAQQEIDALATRAEEWSQRIRYWFTRSARRHERTRLFMERRLEMYGLRVREETGRATVPLPDATISTTHRKARVEIVDEEACADWAERIPGDVLDAVLGDEELVRTTRKVFVGPLRKLARVEAVDAGWEVRAVLACGHVTPTWIVDAEDSDEIPPRGHPYMCGECSPPPLAPMLTEVATVIVERHTRPEVVGLDGEPVPGVAVKPAETTATVKVNR